jgi:hypothetical protein
MSWEKKKLNHTLKFWNIFLKIQSLTSKGNQSYKIDDA